MGKTAKKDNPAPKNAVIYARYSSDNQREESTEGQLRECKEYAEREGITILTDNLKLPAEGVGSRVRNGVFKFALICSVKFW